MDNNEPREQPVPTLQEGETSSEMSVDTLPAALGFVETDELRDIKAIMHEAIESGDTEKAMAIVNRYQTAGEHVIDEIQGDRAKIQIGFIIAVAQLRLEAGDLHAYIRGLDDALTYALGRNFEDVIRALDTAIDQAFETGNGQAQPK